MHLTLKSILAMALDRYYRAAILLLPFILSACSTSLVFEREDGGPNRYVDVSTIPDAVPRAEPKSRYGNPTSYAIKGKRYYVLNNSSNYIERGIASWYGTKFHGQRTSSGETYDMYAMTAAHKTLPLPSYVSVKNLRNHRSIIVKVNDRGPFIPNRIIDLSYTAAKKLGITGNGTGLVEIRVIDPTRKPVPRTTVVKKPPPPPARRTVQTKLYLQVGAFLSRHNAERLRKRLKSIAMRDIAIQHAYEKKKPIYRVRIGPMASINEADRMADRLSKNGFGDSRIVID